MKIAINPGGKPPTKKTQRVHFDSLYELHEFLEDGPGKDPASVVGTQAHTLSNRGDHHRPSEQTATEEWDLKCGWDKAKEMAFGGWEEGLEEVKAFGDKVEAEWPNAEIFAQADGIDFAMSDEGEEVCVDSYLDGDDMHWRAPVFMTDKPIIRIGVNIGALGGVSSHSMKARGIICCAAIKQIERMGFGVQLYAVHVSHDASSHGIISRSVMVKDSDEYVHDATIAFWVAHPAAIRRVSFRLIEASPYEPSRIGNGMGATQEFASPDLDYITPSVHAMERSGALQDEDKMMEATVKMVEKIIRDQVQVTDQFAR